MATNVLNGLLGGISNVGGKLANALLGTANTTNLQQQEKYPAGLQNYLDSLENQPYMKDFLNQPKETRPSLEQIKEGVAQGLNFGIPEIADAQDALKVNKPQTGEQIDLAQMGQFNSYPLQGGLTTSPRQGGFLNDLAAGYRENYSQGFNPSNLEPQNKNFATRTGELLGSVGRFVDSPLGRGLIAAGLTSALGYKNPLKEGLTAMTGRQSAKTNDELFRKSLQDAGIDTSNIRGNVTSELYKNLMTNSYKYKNLDQNTYLKMKNYYDSQLQSGILSPEAYKANVEALNNQYVNSQIQTMQAGNVGVSNQTRNTNMNEQLLPYKQYALQMSPQVALGNLGVAQGNLALRQQELPYDIAYKQAQIENFKNKGNEKLSASQKDAQSTLSQIGTIRNLVKANPTATGLAQGYTPGDIINRVDKNPEHIKTRTAIDALRTKVRHDLTGAQFSPKEAREYEKFLPTNKDRPEIINAKLDALEQRYYADFGVSLTGQNNPSLGTTSSGVKYKVVE